jgi:hypothetical protein
MNLFWVYDIPSGLFAVLVVISFASIAVAGQRLSRRWVKRMVGSNGDYNDLVNTTLATIGVFFGITLGLISVGAWQNYVDISTNVNEEVTAINVVYRSVSLYPDTVNPALKSTLKNYVSYVIQEEWPAQKRGVLPKGGTDKVTAFQSALYAYEPTTEAMKAVHTETIVAFNDMIRHRRSRLQSVTSGLPTTLWLVVIMGSLLNIMVPWFLVYERQLVQDLMIILTAATIGLLVFLMAAMDYPFRGEFSVSADSFQIMFDRMNYR